MRLGNEWKSLQVVKKIDTFIPIFYKIKTYINLIKLFQRIIFF